MIGWHLIKFDGAAPIFTFHGKNPFHIQIIQINLQTMMDGILLE